MLDEKKLKEYLITKYSPLAIILHGSRASGRNRPNSDWDIVLVSKEKKVPESEIIDGIVTDITILDPDISDEILLKEIRNIFKRARLIFDTHNIGQNLLVRAQRLASSGYKMEPGEYEEKKMFLFRSLQRLSDFAGVDQVAFAYHLGSFIQRSVNFYFQLNNQWSESVGVASARIKIENPEFFKDLEIVCSNGSPFAIVESAKRIYKFLFAEEFII